MNRTNLKLVPNLASRTLPIKTMYYDGNVLMRKNSASNPLRAVSRAVEHMRLNSYASTVCEVFDETNGALHAVVKRAVDGNIRIVYERKVQKTEVL